MKNYAKALVAALSAALLAAQVALGGDNGIDASEWLTIALAVLGAIGVYAVPNAPAGAGDSEG